MGPTCSPAFSLENYKWTQNLNWRETRIILGNYLKLLFSKDNRIIWTFLTEEMPKHSIKKLVSEVSKIHEIHG